MPATALMASWNRDLAVLAPDALPGHVTAVATDLLARWEEPQRHYHRLAHLVELFWALDELEDAGEINAGSMPLARVAGWFHDAVYDPAAGSGANEAESAWLATDTLTGLGVASASVRTVESLVALTAGHELGIETPTQRAFHDADLWIFASDASRFDGYCQQIRREYAHVSDPAYRVERSRVLRAFADREELYFTEHARAEWQPRAVANLDRELARLHAARR
jgi:predicted metal-dependent HD superfamily phosphohydrolase